MYSWTTAQDIMCKSKHKTRNMTALSLGYNTFNSIVTVNLRDDFGYRNRVPAL